MISYFPASGRSFWLVVGSSRNILIRFKGRYNGMLILGFSSTAVSYTHLDVYKRQPGPSYAAVAATPSTTSSACKGTTKRARRRRKPGRRLLYARPANPQQETPAPFISQPPSREQTNTQSTSPAPSTASAKAHQERPCESRGSFRASAGQLTAYANTLV